MHALQSLKLKEIFHLLVLSRLLLGVRLLIVKSYGVLKQKQNDRMNALRHNESGFHHWTPS